MIGTIGTAVDASRNQAMGWKAGIFGFFEVLLERYDVAKAIGITPVSGRAGAA